jgi:flagellar hook protein FlgE
VRTSTRNLIGQQGDLRFTTSDYDLAVNGGGFFLVQDTNGQTFMTRAGSFVPNGDGELINAAGFKLLGYSYANGTPSANANGFGGLEPVKVSQTGLSATPSTTGVFTANLPADAAIVPAGNLPSTNSATATYSAKSSLVAYDNLGRSVILDVYFSKSANNTWQATVYNQANAAPNTSFPYTAPAMATVNLAFNPANGELMPASPSSITLAIPGGSNLNINLSEMTQLAQAYTPITAELNGSAPSPIDSIKTDADGTVYAQYTNGSVKALYRVPLANVVSPDELNVLPGNVFSQSNASGSVQIGFPGEGGKGAIISGALESSNVDVAEELTAMIESQRSYTANSKVFQTGADLMDVLVNLKR